MNPDYINTLEPEEQVSLELRGLYRSHGFRPFKVSRFEEYDFYMRNRNFLTSQQILTFTDANGKLMALKPDITLSVVRSASESDFPIRVSYAETAYRVPRGAYSFREIMQVGLEYLGEVDTDILSEVVLLAVRSLAVISPSYALDISDMGILSGILAGEVLTDSQRKELLALVASKNQHTLRETCERMGVSAEGRRRLESIVRLYGPIDDLLPQLNEIGLPESCDKPLRELRAIADRLREEGVGGVNLDFSVTSDMNYYNGLLFSGFVDGIPGSILTGGRYDPIMERMGKSGGALGFAVYLDQISRLKSKKEAKI